MLRNAVILLSGVLLLSLGLAAEEPELPKIEGAKVLMIIASQKFRDEELFQPRGVLLKQGASVKVASSSLKEARGMLGGTFKPELLLKDAKADDFDAVIFVGGSGAKEYWDSAVAHGLAISAFKQGKIVGAICIAPVTLARAGILKGKKATVWKSAADDLKRAGAVYTGAAVQTDGKIVTANGPKAAQAFGAALVTALAEKTKDTQDKQQVERSD